MDIEWEDPPEAVVLKSQGKPGRYVDFALALRDHVGKWAVLPGGDTRTEKGAAGTAQNVRRGVIKGFAPRGTYEAVSEGTKVWVRYTGPAPGQEAQEGGQEARRRSTPREAHPDRPDAAVVRQWASTQGLDVPERGRLPEGVWDAYAQALERGEVGLPVRLVQE